MASGLKCVIVYGASGLPVTQIQFIVEAGTPGLPLPTARQALVPLLRIFLSPYAFRAKPGASGFAVSEEPGLRQRAAGCAGRQDLQLSAAAAGWTYPFLRGGRAAGEQQRTVPSVAVLCRRIEAKRPGALDFNEEGDPFYYGFIDSVLSKRSEIRADCHSGWQPLQEVGEAG